MTSMSSSAKVSSMTRWIVTLSSASKSLCAMANRIIGPNRAEEYRHRADEMGRKVFESGTVPGAGGWGPP
jgi:hypothetical protein